MITGEDLPEFLATTPAVPSPAPRGHRPGRPTSNTIQRERPGRPPVDVGKAVVFGERGRNEHLSSPTADVLIASQRGHGPPFDVARRLTSNAGIDGLGSVTAGWQLHWRADSLF